MYKDQHTVRVVAEKAVRLFDSLGARYEVIIVDDGSPDRAGPWPTTWRASTPKSA